MLINGEPFTSEQVLSRLDLQGKVVTYGTRIYETYERDQKCRTEPEHEKLTYNRVLHDRQHYTFQTLRAIVLRGEVESGPTRSLAGTDTFVGVVEDATRLPNSFKESRYSRRERPTGSG